MIWIILVFISITLDQLSKFAIVKNITVNSSTPVINDFFYITHIRNTGAAWSILQNGRYFFLILTPVILGALVYYMLKSKSKLLNLSLSFIIGGAIGNFIDRLLRGSVVDFFQFHFGSYHFPIFNVADCFVVVGTFILAYYLLFIHKDNTEDKKEAE
jgi:signal peptidase II